MIFSPTRLSCPTTRWAKSPASHVSDLYLYSLTRKEVLEQSSGLNDLHTGIERVDRVDHVVVHNPPTTPAGFSSPEKKAPHSGETSSPRVDKPARSHRASDSPYNSSRWVSITGSAPPQTTRTRDTYSQPPNNCPALQNCPPRRQLWSEAIGFVCHFKTRARHDIFVWGGVSVLLMINDPPPIISFEQRHQPIREILKSADLT